MSTSPQWSPDGRSVYFISDADGRPNVYRADAATGKADRVTAAAAGIAGITPTSAAVSMAAKLDRMAVTLFRDSGYEIHILDMPSDARRAGGVRARTSRDLPPTTRSSDIVGAMKAAPTEGLPAAATFKNEPYKPRLKLVSVGQSAGITSSQFGTYFGGGVSLGFSDVLGEHLIGASIGLNGGARDVGASLSYLNRQKRWNWGVFGERAPLRVGRGGPGVCRQEWADRSSFSRKSFSGRPSGRWAALTAYPFSRVSRVEFSGDVQRIGFEQEVREQTFDPFTGQQLTDTSTNSRWPIRSRSSAGPAPSCVTPRRWARRGRCLATGCASRSSQTGGDLRFTTVTTDFRQYAMPVQPVTVAGRVLHIARYGAGGEDGRLVPLFLGYPTLVRGYDSSSFSSAECTPTSDGSCPEFDRLIGSRILVLNGEVRAPAFGLFRGKLDYGAVPVDILAFVDAGVAWTSTTKPAFAGGNRTWAVSTGVGARFNLFGIVGEFDLAHPFDRPTAQVGLGVHA